jgi:hypothetical protein
MLKLKVTYPSKEEELEILRRMARTSVNIPVNRIVTTENILHARSIVDQVYMDEKIQKYIVDIVEATREPDKHNLADLKLLIQYGASPRATIGGGQQGLRLPAEERLRYATGCEDHRHGRAAPPRDPQLRGRGREQDIGRYR